MQPPKDRSSRASKLNTCYMLNTRNYVFFGHIYFLTVLNFEIHYTYTELFCEYNIVVAFFILNVSRVCRVN